MKRVVLFGMALGLLLGACAAHEPPVVAVAPTPVAPSEPVVAPEPASCPEAPGLCFDVEPADAVLELNGELVGALDAAGKGVRFVERPAGIYQITLRREGYRTWRGEVSVQDGAERIQVRLSPVDP